MRTVGCLRLVLLPARVLPRLIVRKVISTTHDNSAMFLYFERALINGYIGFVRTPAALFDIVVSVSVTRS